MEASYSFSLHEFLARFTAGFTAPELALVRRAYVLAEALHRGQTRDEGTAYFNHPLSVARTVAEELQQRTPVLLCGALLHDVVEDSQLTVEDLTVIFGAEVARTVELLTKVAGVATGDYLAAIEAASPTVALPIKLCDRLDNLRGLHLSRKPGKRAKYLQETATYFLPLAARHQPYLYEQMGLLLEQLAAPQLPEHS